MNNDLEWREALSKLISNDLATRKKLYQTMYTRKIGQVRDELNDRHAADRLFQQAFVVWFEGLKREVFSLQEIPDRLLAKSVTSHFDKIVHSLLLRIETSANYLISHIKKGDQKAKDRLTRAIISPQTTSYARRLAFSLNLRSLQGDDFVQVGMVIMLKNIESGKFLLSEGATNDIHQKQLHKYFRETIYRQMLKQSHKDRKETQVHESLLKVQNLWSEPPIDDSFEVSVFQSFFTLDNTSQKILKTLFLEQLSPKEVAKKIDHPDFSSAADIVAHKNNCIQKLKTLTSAKISEMDSRAMKEYLRVIRSILQGLQEPCKTILKHVLPPLQCSYQEVLELVQSLPSTLRTHLTSVDQLKKRKYKCLQQVQELIWKYLLTHKHAYDG